MPAEWGYTEENRTEPVRGAALPMGFNRTPHYTRGLLLAGDAGRHGEHGRRRGDVKAVDSANLAAQVIAQALARPDVASAERVLHNADADALKPVWLALDRAEHDGDGAATVGNGAAGSKGHGRRNPPALATSGRTHPMIAPLRIGTRGSPLALWQAEYVAGRLAAG